MFFILSGLFFKNQGYIFFYLLFYDKTTDKEIHYIFIPFPLDKEQRGKLNGSLLKEYSKTIHVIN